MNPLKRITSRLWAALSTANATPKEDTGCCPGCGSALSPPKQPVGMIFTDSPDVDAFHDAARRGDVDTLGRWRDWEGDPDLWTAFVQHCPTCCGRYLSVWSDPPGMFRLRFLTYLVPLPGATDGWRPGHAPPCQA